MIKIVLTLHTFQVVSSVGDQIRVKDKDGVFHIVTKVINLRPKDKTSKRASEEHGEYLHLSPQFSDLRAASVDQVNFELEKNADMKKHKAAIREVFIEILNTPTDDMPMLIRSHIKSHKHMIDTKGQELGAANGGLTLSVTKLMRMIGNIFDHLS